MKYFNQVLLSILGIILYSDAEQYLLKSVSGKVGANNYTYYELTMKGDVRIELTSDSGDVDIYISSTLLKPTYIEYDLKSETCGDDIIEIPAEFNRPIGIAIFGQHAYEVSKFTMKLYSEKSQSKYDHRDEDDESTGAKDIFTVFKLLIEFIFEVLL